MIQAKMTTMAFGGALAAICLACAVAMPGCGGADQGPTRVVVSGKVAYQGQPVADGMVRFSPVEGENLPRSGASIVGGAYRADAHGGVPAGTHRVEIEAFRPVSKPKSQPPADDLDVPETLRQQYLPAKFNRKTQLTITVPSDRRSMTHDFNLTD